jgi:hypothetical protein
MRSLLVLVLALLVSGCAYKSIDFSQLQMQERGSRDVYYGVVKHTYAPGVLTITVDIDRRIYHGNYELTAPNTTFGFARIYDRTESTAGAASTLGNTTYGIAILSSTDKRVLRCDFASGGNNNGRGICVEDSGRVYIVALS